MLTFVRYSARAILTMPSQMVIGKILFLFRSDSEYLQLCTWGNILYFLATSASAGRSLWVSKGALYTIMLHYLVPKDENIWKSIIM